MEVLLKNIGTIITGNTPSKKNSKYWNSNDICFVKPGVIGDGVDNVNQSNEYISNYASSKARIVGKNTILITCIGNIGRVGIVSKEKIAFNQQISAIVPNCKINFRYLAYVLLFSKSKLNAMANSAVVPIINKTQLENFKIKIDSNLEHQAQIVEALDKIEEIKRIQDKEIKYLDTLIKARFVEMFGDPIINTKDLSLVSLGKLCTLKAGEFTAAKEIHANKDNINRYPCFGGNGVRGYVDNYTHDGNYSLIGRQGALCGNVQLTAGKFRNTEHAILVKPNVQVNYYWLFMLLKLEKLNRFSSGAAQPGLAVKTLNKIFIPIADLNLQNEFASFAQQVDKSKVVNNLIMKYIISIYFICSLI